MKARLSDTVTAEPICLDTGCSVTLLDKKFFESQGAPVPVCTMANPISVREIGSDKHMTSEYVVVPIYLLGKSVNGKPVEATFTREAHLVEGLKAKMLVGMNIMGPEQIDLITSKGQAVIGSCGDANISIEIRSKSSPVKRTIHARRAMVIPPHSKQPISIHHVRGLPERDFLFEPGPTAFTQYAHMVDSICSAILAQNDSDQAIHVVRNQRLGHITKIKYDGCYNVDIDAADLAIQQPRSAHKSGWLKRLFRASTAMLAMFSLAASPHISMKTEPPTLSEVNLETVLPNGVIVHGKPKAVKAIMGVVNKYPDVWKDSGKFVDLSKNNWMRIPLKPDYHVFGKARVYPLGVRDREIVDKTFDELHQQNRMS